MPTLDKLADQINQAFEDADYYAGEANQSRINAGKLLLEAHDKFHEWRLATINRGVDGVPSWKTWCDGTIKKANGEPRSWSDIKKVMALARAPDPHAALDAERSARNASMAKSRIRKAQGSHVGASATTPAARPAHISPSIWKAQQKANRDGPEVAEPYNPAGAEPSSPTVTEPPAPAPQVRDMALHQECLALVNSWLVSFPPAADIRAVMALIKSMQGATPPRPNVQPEATVH